MTSTVIGMDTMDMILKDPETLFKYLAGTLVTIGITLKVWPYLKSYTGTNSISIGSDKNKKDNQKNQKPLEIQSLQRRFLPVFFLFRMSFWMAGPYFFQVYSSKTFALSGSTSSNITPEATTKEFVRRISLVGYLAILLLSPLTGKFTEKYGLKTATICAGIMYLVGSISVFSNTSLYLYAGRAIGSVASPWLCSAPESWLIGEFLIIQKRILDKKEKENASSSSNKKKMDDDEDEDEEEDEEEDEDEDEEEEEENENENENETTKVCWLSETFALAYGGDPIIAIIAGQTASVAAKFAGDPTGPFSLSPWFIVTALVIVTLYWVENKSGGGGSSSKEVENNKYENKKPSSNSDSNSDEDDDEQSSTEQSGLQMILSDPKILLVGLVQTLFEGSMYIFVVVWSPAVSNSVKRFFGPTAVTPFGTVFSCFMACAFIGSIICGKLSKSYSVDVKSTMTGILLISTISFSVAVYAIQTQDLFTIIVAFFTFEACVGMYFPSIGALRGKLIPESHRSMIMALFTIPLKVLVIGVIYFHPTLGDIGALIIASVACGIAAVCMIALRSILREEEDRQRRLDAKKNWVKLKSASVFLSALQRPKSKSDLLKNASIRSVGRRASQISVENNRQSLCTRASIC